MKKIWILLLLPLTAFAQHRMYHQENKMTAEQQASLRAKAMKVRMDLTDKQEKEVKATFLTHLESRPEKPQNPRDLSSDERYEMRLKFLEHIESLEENLKDILTEEQYAQFKKHSKERMGHRKKRKHKRMKKKNDSPLQ